MVKLSGTQARRFLAEPKPGHAVILLHGPEPMRTADARLVLGRALAGPEAEAEMRLERVHGDELRRDPARLPDLVRAQGFFSGPRVIVVENAGDAIAPAIETVLESWAPGDATVILAAGQLAARSRLRKLVEGHPRGLAIGIYADPPGRAEVLAEARAAGIATLTAEGEAALLALAEDMAPGDLRLLLERLALFTLDAPGPVTEEDVAAVAPLSRDADTDTLIAAALGGEVARLPALLRRLEAQGVQPVQMMIALGRELRALHRVASHPDGPAEGLRGLRPPAFGPRRERMMRLARALGVRRTEAALALVHETDLALRSGGALPAAALAERALVRLAMLCRGR